MAADRPTNFGGKLREARERRGVSLRDVATATKISVAALEALERNDISRLPGGIFSRAFVRAYAVEVGLPPDETVQEFIASFPHESVTAGHPTAKPVEDTQAFESNRSMVTTFLRLVGLSIPIAAAVLYFGTVGRRAPKQPPSPTPAVLAAPVPTPPAPALQATTPSASESIDPSRLAVVLTVSRQCWVSAEVDGMKAFERTLQAGERQTLDVRSELVLKTGDAGAVSLTLNGLDARPLGKSGEVVTVRMRPSNFKDFLQNP